MPKPPRADEPFETVYPRYPFAELVRLSILLGRWLARVRMAAGRAAKSAQARRRIKMGRVV